MTSIHNAISAIDRSKETWHIRGKVIGLYRKSFTSLGQVDMLVVVFMDVEGNTIEAIIRKNMVARFSEQLIPERSYAVKLFNVIEQSGGYRYSAHPFRISFNFLTVVSAIDQINVPRCGFKFVSFEDIASNKLDANYLVDVIGLLSYTGDLENTEPHGTPARVSHKLNFELKSISTKSDIVVIIQFVKIEDFCGQTYINNAYSGTTLVLDQSVAEIVDFKPRFSFSSNFPWSTDLLYQQV